jgi:hypothetical protein
MSGVSGGSISDSAAPGVAPLSAAAEAESVAKSANVTAQRGFG